MQKISSLQAFVLRAPDGGRPHWVSNAIVSRGSELLLCLRTSAGIEGFGLATARAASHRSSKRCAMALPMRSWVKVPSPRSASTRN